MTKFKILVKWKNGELTTDTYGPHSDWGEMLKRAEELYLTYDSVDTFYYLTWQPDQSYKPILWSLPKIFYIEKEDEDDQIHPHTQLQG